MTWKHHELLNEKEFLEQYYRMTEAGMVDGIINSMDMSLSKLQEMVKDREACHAAIHGFTKTWTQLNNKNNNYLDI